ncbi:hypothetical protein EYF80_026335 [Liparis tanakae]|uniref:Uncharacterized protein n=1 Tax=Liparis tanakae TaxID=230148 RepID=A0A4Z2HDZ0_9TELE|nr:hypothetical protein EYF80_026335 [Liparis tanakae]
MKLFLYCEEQSELLSSSPWLRRSPIQKSPSVGRSSVTSCSTTFCSDADSTLSSCPPSRRHASSASTKFSRRRSSEK